jgi:hypothetical protein
LIFSRIFGKVFLLVDECPNILFIDVTAHERAASTGSESPRNHRSAAAWFFFGCNSRKYPVSRAAAMCATFRIFATTRFRVTNRGILNMTQSNSHRHIGKLVSDDSAT